MDICMAWIGPMLEVAGAAIPVIKGIVDKVTHHEDNAKAATSVAADPAAPKEVKEAAARVAATSIDDAATAAKKAVAVVVPTARIEASVEKAPAPSTERHEETLSTPAPTDSSSTLIYVAASAALLYYILNGR